MRWLRCQLARFMCNGAVYVDRTLGGDITLRRSRHEEWGTEYQNHDTTALGSIEHRSPATRLGRLPLVLPCPWCIRRRNEISGIIHLVFEKSPGPMEMRSAVDRQSRRVRGQGESEGLGDRGTASARPRSPLVHTASHAPSSKSPPLPTRSPLRPPARSVVPTKDAHTPQDMPGPILRLSSSTSFSIDTLVDTLPTTNIIIDGAFLNDKPRIPPYLSMPRTSSPDKPLPITPLSPSSPNSMDDSTLDSPSLRDPIDSPPPSATLSPKILSTGLTKRTHALLELIESERAYASDLALIRDIHLPVALGMCFIFLFPPLPQTHVISYHTSPPRQ